MRFELDIHRDSGGHYAGALGWDGQPAPFEFSGLLELLSVIEREVTAGRDRATGADQAVRAANQDPTPQF